MKKLKIKPSVLAVLAIVTVFCIIAAIVYAVIERVAPDLWNVLAHGNQEDIENFVRGAGAEGVLALFVLQFLQVISIVFPGMPIQITSGIVYGAFKGFLICYSGYFCANLLVFTLARRLGADRIRELLGSEHSKVDFIGRSQYPAFMVMIGCMAPVIPNGIVPYAASISRVSRKGFCAGILLGSFPGILIFCAVGNQIMQGNFILAVLLCVLQIVLMIVLVRNQTAIMNLYIRLRQRLQNFLHTHRQQE